MQLLEWLIISWRAVLSPSRTERTEGELCVEGLAARGWNPRPRTLQLGLALQGRRARFL